MFKFKGYLIMIHEWQENDRQTNRPSGGKSGISDYKWKTQPLEKTLYVDLYTCFLDNKPATEKSFQMTSLSTDENETGQLQSFRFYHGKIVNIINDLYSSFQIFFILPILYGCFTIIQVSFNQTKLPNPTKLAILIAYSSP